MINSKPVMNPNRPFPTMFPVTWFVFVTLIAIQAPRGQGDTTEFSNCSSTIQCGSLQNVGYPFWGVNRADYCGNGTEYELTCVSNTTLEMTLSGLTYRVLASNNSSRVLTVAREEYYTTICPQYLHNISSISPFSYSNVTIPSNLTLYYICSASLSGISSLPSSLFTCANYNGSTSITGYFVTRNASDIPGAAELTSALGGCVNNVVLPVTETALLTIQNSPTTGNVEAALQDGFGLQWDDDSGACGACIGSGGECGRNLNNNTFACYCSDKSYPSTCGSSGGEFHNKLNLS